MAKTIADNDNLRESLIEMGYEDEMDEIVIFENPSYASAVVGIEESSHKLVYSMEKMIEHLMTQDNMSEDDAIEFIEYNTIRSLPYMDNAPIVMRDVIM